MLSNSIYSMLPKYKFIYEERNVELPNYLNREIKNNWNELINSGKKIYKWRIIYYIKYKI